MRRLKEKRTVVALLRRNQLLFLCGSCLLCLFCFNSLFLFSYISVALDSSQKPAHLVVDKYVNERSPKPSFWNPLSYFRLHLRGFLTESEMSELTELDAWKAQEMSEENAQLLNAIPNNDLRAKVKRGLIADAYAHKVRHGAYGMVDPIPAVVPATDASKKQSPVIHVSIAIHPFLQSLNYESLSQLYNATATKRQMADSREGESENGAETGKHFTFDKMHELLAFIRSLFEHSSCDACILLTVAMPSNDFMRSHISPRICEFAQSSRNSQEECVDSWNTLSIDSISSALRQLTDRSADEVTVDWKRIVDSQIAFVSESPATSKLTAQFQGDERGDHFWNLFDELLLLSKAELKLPQSASLQKMGDFSNADFTLSMTLPTFFLFDSVQFALNWDVSIMRQWMAANNEFAVLSSLPPFVESNEMLVSSVLCSAHLDDSLHSNSAASLRIATTPRFMRLNYRSDLKPALLPFVTPHFMFSKRHRVKTVALGSGIRSLFRGRVLDMSARLFTHGYDVYSVYDWNGVFDYNSAIAKTVQKRNGAMVNAKLRSNVKSGSVSEVSVDSKDGFGTRTQRSERVLIWRSAFDRRRVFYQMWKLFANDCAENGGANMCQVQLQRDSNLIDWRLKLPSALLRTDLAAVSDMDAFNLADESSYSVRVGEWRKIADFLEFIGLNLATGQFHDDRCQLIQRQKFQRIPVFKHFLEQE